jgi:membrane protease YdiL (CAAX protease family)
MSAVLKRIGRLDAAPPWGFFTAVTTLFVAVLASVIIGTLFAVSFFGDQPYYPLVAWSVGSLLTIVYVNISRRADREHLRLQTGRSRLFIVLLFSLGMAITIDVIGLLSSGQFMLVPELLPLLPARESIAGWVLAALFLLALQPLAEQLVFSGVFFPAARHMLGAWGGYLATVGVFALFHYLVYGYPPVNGLWPSLIAPLLAGLVIIGARANAGSTRSAIVAQIGFGLFALTKLVMISAG